MPGLRSVPCHQTLRCMPEYQAPGVFVEEVPSGPRRIEGVPTSTAAFVGPTRTGPVGEASPVLTSFLEFQQRYGGLDPLEFSAAPNYLAHAVRSFFEEGGRRLHVVRVAGASATAESRDLLTGRRSRFVSRYPGAAGNLRVELRQEAEIVPASSLAALPPGSLVRVAGSPGRRLLKRGRQWRDAGGVVHSTATFAASPRVQLITARIAWTSEGGRRFELRGLGMDSRHPRHLGALLSPGASKEPESGRVPFLLEAPLMGAFEWDNVLAPRGRPRVRRLQLSGGTDAEPTAAEHGEALRICEGLEDVALVAAPGHAARPASFEAVSQALREHVGRPGAWRFALLDPPPGVSVAEVRSLRAGWDSGHAALYYPWVVIRDPQPGRSGEVVLPPSGFLCGAYARQDAERGVWKAPAGVALRTAIRFERALSAADQDVLNPEGVNCLRVLAGRGPCVWGARTLSSDPEWRYVPIRRYVSFVQHSLERGLQWTVFEPNGEALWSRVRDAIEVFLLLHWREGALLGDRPDQAFLVRCDRTTLTPEDLSAGRLGVQVGLAPLKPGEFLWIRCRLRTA